MSSGVQEHISLWSPELNIPRVPRCGLHGSFCCGWADYCGHAGRCQPSGLAPGPVGCQALSSAVAPGPLMSEFGFWLVKQFGGSWGWSWPTGGQGWVLRWMAVGPKETWGCVSLMMGRAISWHSWLYSSGGPRVAFTCWWTGMGPRVAAWGFRGSQGWCWPAGAGKPLVLIC